MKPICVPCKQFYRPKKNGIAFVEAMPKAGTSNPPPGNVAPELWTPYKLWVGDLWECRGCGHQIISGVPHTPVAEHFQDNFGATAKQLGVHCTINDC